MRPVLSINLCSSSFSYSSKQLFCVVQVLFACLDIVLVRVLSCLIVNSLFLVICRMLEVNEYLTTTVLEVLRVGKPQRGSMEALIFHRNITKSLYPLVECHQF